MNIMKTYKFKVKETTSFLKARTQEVATIGLLTGTGLGETIPEFNVTYSEYYQNIPNFPISTVQSHDGKLVIGKLQHQTIIAMQGRFHLYEGYSSLDVAFPIRVMQQMGVKYLILTNAAGGIRPTFQEGDIMIICDHINLTGENPLIGPNEPEWGVRFPDMSAVYDQTLMTFAETAGKHAGILLKKGVYAGLKGPSLETPAEIRFLKGIGADAVGFSTVLEVITAIHAGMKILALSSITNVHNPNMPVPSRLEDIIAVANKTAPKIRKIIQLVIEEIEANERS